GLRDSTYDRRLRNCFVRRKKEILCRSKRRSEPDRVHGQRLPSNSARLPPANRLQLGWYARLPGGDAAKVSRECHTNSAVKLTRKTCPNDRRGTSNSHRSVARRD